MKEVQIIKASKDKVIRSGATIKNKIRVAPYARVSTDSDEQKNSYESQKKYYQELVSNNHEWELVDIYADEAISGTQVYKRTDFMRMINDAMDGKIDMIITKSISRFARNTLDTLSYVRQLKDKGVAVFFEKENINTLTMNGELLLVILSSLAQQESESIGGNIKLGLKMKMSRGERVGFNRCLGYSYDKDTKEISIVPEEAETVPYIFKRYIEGIGTYALAKELTRKGFKNAKGEVKWRDGSVACILKNEKYKGDLLQGKSFTVDSISHKRLSNKGESDKFYLENHHEPIISREVWDKAESIRKSRNRIIGVEDNRRTKSRQHSFSCMIECAYCGSHFIRRTWHSSSKNEKHVRSCIKRTNTGRKYCPKSESIDEKTLEKCFVEVYNMLLDNNKEIIDNLTGTIEKIVLEEFDNGLIDNKNKEINLIDKKISSLLDLGLESKIENTILENKMNELTKEKSKIQNELNKLIEQRDSKENYNSRINDIKNKLNTLNRLESFDRQVFEYMISKIIIGKSDDNEKQNPLHITFVLKTDDEISSYTNSTNKKRSLNNARLDIERDTCGEYSIVANEKIKYVKERICMKVLLFTHKNDIDGMGNAVLAKLAFSDVDYVLCGTFDLTKNIMKYIEDGSIYDYDFIFVTDLCLEDPVLSRIDSDEKLKGKVLDLDHHRTFMDEKYTKYDFINVCVSDSKGLCCGTSLFYEYLVSNGYIEGDTLVIKEFVELTRQHDTWEWKNIYNNEKARELATFFDVVGCDGYINMMIKKLENNENKSFEFEKFERTLIDNRLIQVEEKLRTYADNVIYRDILGLRAGIVFITYEYRNELAQYFKDNNYDMDFAMMIALDPGVICYRSVRDGVKVRPVAELFGGKGHEKAASNPISEEMNKELIKVLTRTKK